jgi:CubicO group peptidase (beta-lactamase class C family)
MAKDMIFDLASLTKPVATAPSIMILAEQGRLSLTEKVKDYVPEFEPYLDETGKPGEDARLWHLLTHTSGLPPYLSSTDPAELEKMLGPSIATADLVAIIAKLKKSDPPGKAFHYSCLGYITLAHIIRQITGQTVAQFAAEHIFRPLRLEHTFYNPPAAFKDKCVPTQVLDGNPLRGIVHDPLARLQGGVSGNAGLFSTADDLAVFCQMILNKGTFEGKKILSPLTVERMTEVYPQAAFAGYGLGWDLDSDYSTNGGDLFGPRSFGHTGYTGTSMWIDPETDIFLIFLTNRIHPDDKGSIVALRSRLANVVAAALLTK